MKILIVSSFLLSKESRFGGSLRLYHLMKALSRFATLDIICLDACNEFPLTGNGTADFSRSLILPNIKPAVGWGSRITHTGDTRKTMRLAIRELSGFVAESYEATILAFPWALSALDVFQKSQLGKIVYLEDDLLLESMRKRAKNESNMFFKTWKTWRFVQLYHYFKSTLKKIDAFIVISKQEKRILKVYFPSLRSQVVTYGLDLENLKITSLPDDFSLGFIGNYHHTPNRYALEWLLEKIFPEILLKWANAKLIIAGANTPSQLRQRFENNPRIIWRGNVASVAEFYNEVRIFVNPINAGRGLRTKVIEAAAYGRPIVSTTLGAEGLDGLDIRIANSPTEFVAALTELAVDATATSVARINRTGVEQGYSAQAAAQSMMNCITSIKSGGAA